MTTDDSSEWLLCSLPAGYSRLRSLRDLLLGDNYLSVSGSPGLILRRHPHGITDGPLLLMSLCPHVVT